jgi:hypothetical protein
VKTLVVLLLFAVAGCNQDDGTSPTAPGRVTEPVPAPDAGMAAAAAMVPPAGDAGAAPEAAPAAPEAAAPPTDAADGTVYRTCAGANPVTTTVTNCDETASLTLGAPARCVAADGAHLYGCELSNPSGVPASCVKICP